MSGNTLDKYRRLPLDKLDGKEFERFFLNFLSFSGVRLTIARDGETVRRAVSAVELYNSASGQKQNGIDLRLQMEGGEIWCFQCKAHKRWTLRQTKSAIVAAESKYPAQHYFLAVGCDPGQGVQDEVHKHPRWSLWTLETICSEVRRQIPPESIGKLLHFLHPEEIRKFAPFSTSAFLEPKEFFQAKLDRGQPFSHGWKLVGRERELEQIENFVRSETDKALVLVAPGGEGKTRLLYEVTQLFESDCENEIRFLNPHRSDDDFDFVLADCQRRLLIVVDDAHRTENVPERLLALVRQNPQAKMILSCRPQGQPSLDDKLYRAGFQAKWGTIRVSRLRKKSLRELAKEVLGATHRKHVEALVGMSSESPFLITVAGSMLRQGKMKWGEWNNHSKFRSLVFQAFENQNLDGMEEGDRRLAQAILRSVALLAPISNDPSTLEGLANVLDEKLYVVEAMFGRLKVQGLIEGDDLALRVLPDLYSDFLVYAATYDSRQRQLTLVKRLCSEFRDSESAMLRNLAEASWIARTEGIDSSGLLSPLIESFRETFIGESFGGRARMLNHWGTFAVFLPNETLGLVELVLEHGPRGNRDETPSDKYYVLREPSHEDVLRELPGLLEPIARYHDDLRPAALEFLWELGERLAKPAAQSGGTHPWAVIAEIIRIDFDTPALASIETLKWLEKAIRRPVVMERLEQASSTLGMLLNPCFERFVQEIWWEGPKVSLRHSPMPFQATQPIRDKALQIIEWVIEHGTWLAMLDALSPLEHAVRPVARIDTCHVPSERKFRNEWRPVRRQALGVYEKVLAKPLHPLVHLEAFKTLKRIAEFEEEEAFRAELLIAINRAQLSLAHRVLIALTGHHSSDFTCRVPTRDERMDYKKSRCLWQENVIEVASELIARFETAHGVWEFLNPLYFACIEAGRYPRPRNLFEGIAKLNPQLASDLAREITKRPETAMSGDLSALLVANPSINEKRQFELLVEAVEEGLPHAMSAFTDWVTYELRESGKDRELIDALLRLAETATPQATLDLLLFVERLESSHEELAYEVLDRLPLETVAEQHLDRILDALFPLIRRSIQPTREFVARLLSRLVSVSSIDVDSNSVEFDQLFSQYPLECYDWIKKRIDRCSPGNDCYLAPVPSCFRRRFRLPEIVKAPEYPVIVEELWSKVLDPDGSHRYWRELWQAIVLEDEHHWKDRLRTECENAGDLEQLIRLVDLIRFPGSLILFSEPKLTRIVLCNAENLADANGLKSIRAALYRGCGPIVRSYKEGVLALDDDYVEAEARKALAKHSGDEVLRAFYGWIVELEERDRIRHKHEDDAVTWL